MRSEKQVRVVKREIFRFYIDPWTCAHARQNIAKPSFGVSLPLGALRIQKSTHRPLCPIGHLRVFVKRRESAATYPNRMDCKLNKYIDWWIDWFQNRNAFRRGLYTPTTTVPTKREPTCLWIAMFSLIRHTSSRTIHWIELTGWFQPAACVDPEWNILITRLLGRLLVSNNGMKRTI